MKLRIAVAIMLGIMALVLTGCNSPGDRARFSPRVRLPEQPSALSLTEQGRGHLAAQRTGLAVESFRDALARGEAAAPAYNGLAIAYARLGRPDLAETYFRRAIRSDPMNLHFTENLSRLMHSPAYLAMIGASAETAEEPAPVRLADKAAKEKALPMQRLSRGEVRIVTASAPALAMAPQASLPAPKSALRVARAETDRRSAVTRVSRGEIRITTTPAVLPQPATNSYPVRVQFAANAKPLAAKPKSRTVWFDWANSALAGR